MLGWNAMVQLWFHLFPFFRQRKKNKKNKILKLKKKNKQKENMLGVLS